MFETQYEYKLCYLFTYTTIHKKGNIQTGLTILSDDYCDFVSDVIYNI